MYIYYSILCLCILSLVCSILLSNEAEADHIHDGDVSMYSKQSNEILESIQKAHDNYISCSGMQCYIDTLEKDLLKFKEGIHRTDIDTIKDRGTMYQIIDHNVYKVGECMFPARCSGIEYFLNKIKDNITDIEFVINTRDYPQMHSHHPKALPLFSFSKTSEYYDIMYPAWAFWEGGPAIKLYPTGIGRWDKHRKTLMKEAELFPWDKKLTKGFFRGSRTSNERDPLVLLSQKHPDLIDASYTKNQAWKSNADTLHVPPAVEVSFEEHCKYKYLFNFRGVAASFRFKHLFLCKSLVFHVGDEWIEYFYPALKPWIHYIPIHKHATQEDIKKTLEFFVNHDHISKEIAETGFDFIVDSLKMKHVTQYWLMLLQKYSTLLKYKPIRRK